MFNHRNAHGSPMSRPADIDTDKARSASSSNPAAPFQTPPRQQRSYNDLGHMSHPRAANHRERNDDFIQTLYDACKLPPGFDPTNVLSANATQNPISNGAVHFGRGHPPLTPQTANYPVSHGHSLAFDHARSAPPGLPLPAHLHSANCVPALGDLQSSTFVSNSNGRAPPITLCAPTPEMRNISTRVTRNVREPALEDHTFRFDEEHTMALITHFGTSHKLIWICCSCKSINPWYAQFCSGENLKSMFNMTDDVEFNKPCWHNWVYYQPNEPHSGQVSVYENCTMHACPKCWLLEVDGSRRYIRSELYDLAHQEALARAPHGGDTSNDCFSGRSLPEAGVFQIHHGRDPIFANATTRVVPGGQRSDVQLAPDAPKLVIVPKYPWVVYM